MNSSLAQALINRGILNDTSRIVANCPIWSMGDMPDMKEIVLNVDRIVIDDGNIKLQSTSKSSGRRYSVPCEQVLYIDGMAPERLAAAYDIKPDGLKKAIGAKRGRKPKSLSTEA